jgi:hypothetical protein
VVCWYGVAFKRTPQLRWGFLGKNNALRKEGVKLRSAGFLESFIYVFADELPQHREAGRQLDLLGSNLNFYIISVETEVVFGHVSLAGPRVTSPVMI